MEENSIKYQVIPVYWYEANIFYLENRKKYLSEFFTLTVSGDLSTYLGLCNIFVILCKYIKLLKYLLKVYQKLSTVSSSKWDLLLINCFLQTFNTNMPLKDWALFFLKSADWLTSYLFVPFVLLWINSKQYLFMPWLMPQSDLLNML